MKKPVLVLVTAAALALMGQACLPWAQDASRIDLSVQPPEDAFMDESVKEDGSMMEGESSDDAMMKDDSTQSDAVDDGSVMQDEGMEKQDDSMMGDDKIMDDSNPSSSVPYYIAYSNAEFNRAMRAGKATLLYFYAPWCPICRAEEPGIKSTVESSGLNVAGFRVDYDNEAQLKQKFGVTTQHTTIILDGQGKETVRYVGPVEQSVLVEALRNASQT